MSRRFYWLLWATLAMVGVTGWATPVGWREAIPGPGMTDSHDPARVACDGLGGVHVVGRAGSIDCARTYYNRSLDWGVNWEQGRPFGGIESWTPDVLATGDLIWIFSHIATAMPPPPWPGLEVGLAVWASTDRGSTWSYPSYVDLEGTAHPKWPRAAYINGQLCVVYHKDPDDIRRVYGSSSTDGGSSWSDPLCLTPPNVSSEQPSLATSGGVLHLACTYGFIPAQVRYNRSVDGGQNWVHAEEGFRLSAEDVASESASIAAFGADICVAWSTLLDGVHRVAFCHSADTGMSWSAPQTVCIGGSPTIACDGEGVHLVFLTIPPGQTQTHPYYTTSTDWGETWSEPVALEDIMVSAKMTLPAMTADFQGRHLVYYRGGPSTQVLCYYQQNDILFPAAPQNLHMTYFEDDGGTVPQWYVNLAWNANTEPDILGYHVYRNYEQGDFVRITANPVPGTAFTDCVGSGVWGYYVTAVDLAGNESEGSNVIYFTSPTLAFAIGESVPSPYLLERDGYQAWGERSAHDADIGTQRVRYLKSNFDPDRQYVLGAVLSRVPGHGASRVTLAIDSMRLMTRVELPDSPTLFIRPLPQQVYSDGSVVLSVTCQSGPLAALSEIYIWEGTPLLGGTQSAHMSNRMSRLSVSALPNPGLAPIRLSLAVLPERAGKLSIYDAMGSLVRELRVRDGVATWDGQDMRGAAVAPSTYYVLINGEVLAGPVRITLLR